MNKFEAITVGNIASSPINSKSPHMSPTEKLAFATPVEVAEASLAEVQDAITWEPLSSEMWVEPRLGESVSNSIRRVTRRAAVEGGWLYAVATYSMTYVRGVADNSVSEALQFVPTGKAATPKK